ncbi:MAG: ornithine cyclodeaminase family protein [Armatimonadota bacterium]
MLYLTKSDVISLNIDMHSIINVVEEGFRRKGLGQTQMPPKIAIHPHAGSTFLHAMPAFVGGLEIAGMKWVGGADDNWQRNLPTISGLIVLNDPDTMVPLAIMDCIWITAMRTAAANAVAMKYLGPKDAREAAIIGCGTQGRSNLLGIAATYPNLQQVRAYDINPEALRKYVAEMREETGLPVVAAASPEAAVVGADVVVTAGLSPRDPEPYLEAAWLKVGAMAAPVDYNGAWKTETYTTVDRLITDDHAQMNYYRAKDYFKNVPLPYADLGEIVAGLKPGRQSEDERTMSICLGIAVDDVVTAKLVYDLAREKNVGMELPL